jgi:hypothetical protein
MASKKVVKKVVKKAAPKKAGPRPPVDESRKPRNQRKPMMEPETKKPLQDWYHRSDPILFNDGEVFGWMSGGARRGNRRTKDSRLKYPVLDADRRAMKVKRKER